MKGKKARYRKSSQTAAKLETRKWIDPIAQPAIPLYRQGSSNPLLRLKFPSL